MFSPSERRYTRLWIGWISVSAGSMGVAAFFAILLQQQLGFRGMELFLCLSSTLLSLGEWDIQRRYVKLSRWWMGLGVIAFLPLFLLPSDHLFWDAILISTIVWVIGQGALLVRRLPRLWLWLLANVLAWWPLSMATLLVVFTPPTPHISVWSPLLMGGISGVILGIFRGGALALMLRERDQRQSNTGH